MSTVKWKIKEHYVAGEFAGYVVVTDDKYEDVVCRSIGVDYRSTAVLIASAPELEAERVRLRKALEEITKIDRTCYNCAMTLDDGYCCKSGDFISDDTQICTHFRMKRKPEHYRIAQKALEGEGK